MSKYFSAVSLLLFILGIISFLSGSNGFMLFTLIIINIYLLFKIKGANGILVGFYGLIISMAFGGFGIFLYGLISYFLLFSKSQNE